jgi:hypothetical protein
MVDTAVFSSLDACPKSSFIACFQASSPTVLMSRIIIEVTSA